MFRFHSCSAKCTLRSKIQRVVRISSFRNRFSSQAGDGSIGASKELLKSTAKRKDPLALFPWRHKDTVPPRLQEREREFQNDWIGYDMSTYYVSTLTGKVYLDVPLFASLGQGWRNELADACAWAFTEGVNEIISNVYQNHNSEETSKSSDFPISFDYTKPELSMDEGEQNNLNRSNGESTESIILEQSLLELYQNARNSGKSQIQVHLASKPTGAKLHSLHSLPMLSRSYAERYPDRVAEYERIRCPESRSFESSNKFLNQMLEQTGTIETTLFAEVFLYCDEVFRVSDLQSGALLQGHDDGKIRQVLHGVRLERLVSWTPETGKAKGNWMITDIDDLLDGNCWYTPSNVGHKWWMSG